MASRLTRSRASHEGEGVSRGQLCRANMGSARPLRSARLPLFETLGGPPAVERGDRDDEHVEQGQRADVTVERSGRVGADDECLIGDCCER